MTFFSGYSLKEVFSAITGKAVEIELKSNKTIKHLLTDSRMLVAPESSIFFALVTKNNNGHKYIPELLEKGVRAFVVSEKQSDIENQYPDAVFIKVNNTLDALQKLAEYHRNIFRIPVVAITGSNGKTIVKEWLFQILNSNFKVIRNPKSYNSQIGVPLSVWQLDNIYDIGIFEAGISKCNEMQKLQKILKPDTGIFTNIGPAHDEGFVNRKEKINEKLKLFTGVKKLIYCADYPDLVSEISNWHKNNPSVELCPWSMKQHPKAMVHKIKKVESGTIISYKFKNKLNDFLIPFHDSISLENALHCITFLFYSGFYKNIKPENIRNIQPVAMRMELKQGINNCSIINDAYNSDFQSLSIALDFLSSQLQHSKKRLILSDILQSGISDDKLYEQVAALVKEKNINHISGIGKSISKQAEKFSIPCDFYPDTDTFIEKFNFNDLYNEAILLKGARSFYFEKIIKHIQQKDHQTILEINLDALIHNYKVYKSFLEPGTKVMAMVKAFSYGSGSYEIATTLSRQSCNYFAVAYADEGKELRLNGIKSPIVVMNPEVKNLDILRQFNLEPEIYSLKLFEKIATSGKHFPGVSSKNPFPVHIKVDTGMHRLGFLPGQIKELIKSIKNNPHIIVKSVFSHFAASDMPQHDDFTRKQIKLFKEITNEIEKETGYSFLRHICNSAAISRFPEAHFDMVRLGIGLYGVDKSEKIRPLLKNVSSFKSVVSQLKKIKSGESIGYSRSAFANEDIEIAVIPVGYADGLNRKLSNGKGCLLVNNKKAKIIGNISMDMCTANVTGLDVKEGDEVIVFGDVLPLTELANTLETIPYEVLTSISQRVKRIYFRE